MAKMYIQIKNSFLGAGYDGRSFLVTNKDEQGYWIKGGNIFVPLDQAIEVHQQVVNLEMGTYTVDLVKNYKALAKAVPDGIEFPAKVYGAEYVSGYLYLTLTDPDTLGDDEEEQAWRADRFVITFTPMQYDEAYYNARFVAHKKQSKNIKQEFVEGISRSLFIMKDSYTKPNGEVGRVGYSLRNREEFATPFGFFSSIDELKQNQKVIDLIRKG